MQPVPAEISFLHSIAFRRKIKSRNVFSAQNQKKTPYISAPEGRTAAVELLPQNRYTDRNHTAEEGAADAQGE
jgi:hypothetical protein